MNEDRLIRHSWMSFVALPLEGCCRVWPILSDVLKTTCPTGGGNGLQTDDMCVIEGPVGTAAVAVNARGGR